MIAGTTIMPTLNMECPCLDGQELHWLSTTMLYRYISERRNRTIKGSKCDAKHGAQRPRTTN